MGPSLATELPLAALKQALETRQPKAGLIHHSDQGTQYASHKYVAELQEHGVEISMSRRGNPYDNAFVESFMKTLKAEEVDCNEYATLDEAQAEIGTFIERIYNRKRLHSALGHVPPPKFSRHRQIYRSAGGGARLGKAGCGRQAAPRAHRIDESAAGYSLAGCSPAAPACASPAATRMHLYRCERKPFTANSNPSLISWSHETLALHSVPFSPPSVPISRDNGQ